MSQVDTSIYGRFQPTVKLQSPFEIESGMQQIQQGRDQNRLAQRQFQEADRADAERNALADIAKQYGNTPEYGNELMRGGFMKQSQDYAKLQAEQQKSARDAKKAQIEDHLQKFDITERVMSGVRDEQTWQAARQELAGLFGPEAAAQMPQNYDPMTIEQNRAKAMPIKERLMQQWKEMDYRLKTDEFAYRKENDAASRDVTMRGQDMTDARGRDFNATKVEENTLKREGKADTANLTKQSQIASFDTMIGTLDRIGEHPGLARSVGVAGMLPTMPGSDSANFQAELNTFQSQAFIPMVSQLKGMGALSDAEGKKLTAAVGALDPKMGEEAFRESVARIKEDMNAARARVSGMQQTKQPAKLQVATDYLNGAKDQADFAKRVKALKAKGWADDKIRAAYGQ